MQLYKVPYNNCTEPWHVQFVGFRLIDLSEREAAKIHTGEKPTFPWETRFLSNSIHPFSSKTSRVQVGKSLQEAHMWRRLLHSSSHCSNDELRLSDGSSPCYYLCWGTLWDLLLLLRLFIARICCFRAVLHIPWGNLDSPGLHYPLSQESSSAGAEASWVKPQFFPFRNNWLPPRAHGKGKDYSSPGQVGSGSTNNAREASRKAPRQTKAKRSRRSCHHTGCCSRDFHPGHSLPGPVPTDPVWPLVPLQLLLSHFITFASRSLVLCFVLISTTLPPLTEFHAKFWK